jgi:urease subunit alpha
MTASAGRSADPGDDGPLVPGEVRPGAADRPIGPERSRIRLTVANTSRRVVRVSSHYPFERVNPRLAFDRAAAVGFRLDVPAGATVRWGPGEQRDVDLVRAVGDAGPAADAPAAGESPGGSPGPRPRIPAAEWLARFGPTTDDRIRLGDTELWIRVAEDRTATGDEPIWGYGKTLRSRMAQADDAAADSELDIVIVGVVVVDPSIGVVKADIGIKDGRIAGIGRAGNPAISGGIDLVVGPHTEPIMGYGLIATPGAIDSHVHLVTPELVPVALGAGVTTLITAGFEEPPFAMERTLLAIDGWPVNVGLQAGARADDPGRLEALLEAGAIGLKIHEDYGAYPELIDAVLAFADDHDIAISLHTDGLHESAELEDTVAAIAGRTVHAYHVEGTGGGHLPDLLGLVREPSVLCSSTTPTVPYGPAAPAEHVAMILRNHGGGWEVPGDLELVRERIHPATMAAEGPLHELGAIAIVNSDSQGMGRIGETLRRTIQLAHVMKRWRRGIGAPDGEPPAHPGLPAAAPDPLDDNERVLAYLAKCTVEPAIVHGIAHEVGSLLPGRLADVVLWRPGSFGVKPALVVKGGHVAWGPLGDGNASLEGAEPTRYRPHWGAVGGAPAANAVTFVSDPALAAGLPARLGSRRRFVAVRGCRGLTRASLAHNRATAPIEIDPHDGTVTLGGRLVAVDPVREVPLSRRYLLR